MMNVEEIRGYQEFVSEWFATIDVDQVASSLGVDALLLRLWGGNVSLPLPPPLFLLLGHDRSLHIARRNDPALGYNLVLGKDLFPDSQFVPLQIPIFPEPSREQRNASYWIHFFYRDQKKADAMIGDLDELLDQRLKWYGKRRAIRWYRAHVAWSLIDLLVPLVLRVLGIAAIWRRLRH